MINLASRWLGSGVVAASDESFGEKENLLLPDAPVRLEGRFSTRGEVVDGWETRRRRQAGSDWAIVRLGAPGVIAKVDVDTTHFVGNFPALCSIEACGMEGYPSPSDLSSKGTEWSSIVSLHPLRADAHNEYEVEDARRFTHVRLSTYPDGGVARLRVFGKAVPDPRGLDHTTWDLASERFGGEVIDASDGFYGSPEVLLRPDSPRTIGDGWETRRRRDSGHDFVAIRLASAGSIRQLVIDTSHFKYNASAAIRIQGTCHDSAATNAPGDWTEILPLRALQPDTRHVFPLRTSPVVNVLRLEAFPDGGLARVQVVGEVRGEPRRAMGYSWFNRLPMSQLMQCMQDAGISKGAASGLAAHRPLGDDWMDRVHMHGSVGERGRSETKRLRAFAATLIGDDS
jgi:allantoicase